MKVEEIAEAVANLPPHQLARFRRWFTAFEAGRADHAGELDSAASKLGLSLLKNLFDHRVRSSATATVGDAQNFVRSRNPVTTVIAVRRGCEAHGNESG